MNHASQPAFRPHKKIEYEQPSKRYPIEGSNNLFPGSVYMN